MKLKRIGFLSLGYALAILYALVGLFQGVLVTFAASQPSLAAQIDANTLTVVNAVGGWVILVMPLVAAIIGFLAGIILAAIYNWVIAKLTGGIKIELVK